MIKLFIVNLLSRLLNFINKVSSFFKNNQENKLLPIYNRKTFMTNYELDFYNKIKELEKDYSIIPQINLATIVAKNKKGYLTELFRNIDFAIFNKDFSHLLLLIELNDRSHTIKKRKNRDLKVKKICNDCNYRLITFYTAYPNEKNYVLNRIIKEIEKDQV